MRNAGMGGEWYPGCQRLFMRGFRFRPRRTREKTSGTQGRRVGVGKNKELKGHERQEKNRGGNLCNNA